MGISIKNAILKVLEDGKPRSVSQIEQSVRNLLGQEPSPSSIRSALRLQSSKIDGPIVKVSRGIYALRQEYECAIIGDAKLYKGDAISVMSSMPKSSIHAIVTDPPYGLVEYTDKEKEKLRSGHGGVWRLPPAFDGHTRSPLPRFTTLNKSDLDSIEQFFTQFAKQSTRILVPGGNVIVATNPLVTHIVTAALAAGGLEPRGQIIRLVQTMRGGDRPKGHEIEYRNVSVMPRSQHEPWIVMRKPLAERTVSLNLEKHSTGGWMRISDDRPFGDVIKSRPTSSKERKIAPHPSLKPQSLMRQLVRASLPLGKGIVLDPFAGAGSTLAAAEAIGYESIGIEVDEEYYNLAIKSIVPLSELDAGVVTEVFEPVS